MTFAAPHWFWALALLSVLLALFVWNENRRAILLQRIIALRLAPELAASVSAGKRRLRFAALLAGLACIIVALARPQFGYTWQQSKRKGRDVLVAIDTSKSMMATDLAPNRLTRAKLAAHDLLGLLPGDRLGLIAFAGDAFLQAPLTIDYSAVQSSLDELDTSIIPRGGTDIASAIKVAAEAFGKGESENRALILMTDGEELDENAVAEARRHAQDFRVFTVGVGSAQGALIPVTDEQGGTSFVKDSAGQFVKSKLDENRLREVAQASGGFYVPLQDGPAAMKTIVQNGLEPMKERDIDTRTSRQPIERYQWPLALGLALLAWPLLIGERRRARRGGVQSFALAAALVFMPVCGFSANKGVLLYNQQNYQEALDTFQKQLTRNPSSSALEFDSGAAAYKLGDYDKALESFGQAVTAPDPNVRGAAEYNLGNTLFQRGAKQEAKETKLREWQNALQHYDEALKVDAKNENAKANRDLVRKAIEDLQQPQPTPPPQKQDQKDQQQKKDEQKSEQQKDQQSPQNQSPQNQQEEKKQESKQEQHEAQNKQQNGSEQNQQQQSGNEKPGDEKKQENAKNEQNKDRGDKEPQQNEKGGQASASPRPGSEGEQNRTQAANSPAPAPTPGEKHSGEIKAQSSAEKPSGEKGEPSQVVEAKPGEMSEAQARALIESLRGEDTRVQLNERQGAASVLKDW